MYTTRPYFTLDFSTQHSSPNFYTGSKTAKFGLDFRPLSTTLEFEPPSFQNGVRYLKAKVKLLRKWYKKLRALSGRGASCIIFVMFNSKN